MMAKDGQQGEAPSEKGGRKSGWRYATGTPNVSRVGGTWVEKSSSSKGHSPRADRIEPNLSWYGR